LFNCFVLINYLCVRLNIVDYFDMKSHNLIKDLEFMDLFLRERCNIMPLVH
jgi:hypothetical protein